MDSGIAAPEREALCHALTRVVAERGWHCTSVERVAREAGLAPHEFYDHFRSLEQCYLAVYNRMLVRLTRTVQRSAATRTLAVGPDAWQEQLDAMFTGFLSFFAVEPDLARTCLVEVRHAGPAARARRDRALGRVTAFVEGLRLAHGEPMSPFAAEMVVLGTTELVHNRVAQGEAERLPELLPQLRELWFTTGDEETGAERIVAEPVPA